MKIHQDGFFHLTYCSNIHAGEKWLSILANLKKYIPEIKAKLAPAEHFGIGLRLSNLAADELLMQNALADFVSWLSDNQLYVFTINGFPYGNFHGERVKEQVYAPDWQTPERCNYTLKLIKILAELTPVNGESSISTSPISYKPWLNSQECKIAFEKASINLCRAVIAMAKIYQDQNKTIHVDIEPEPDCLIETTQEAIDFFDQWLIPIGVKYLVDKLKVTKIEAEILIRRHIRFCYDICHSSVEFEEPADVFQKLAKADIKIGKIQISAALKSQLSNDLPMRKKACLYLQKFIDPVYLHQVVMHDKDGNLEHLTDLNLALQDLENSHSDELRTHFHVPIFLENYRMLQSTQNDISKVLKLLQCNKASRHLEIETYTWDVLPQELKVDIISSITREYKWVLQQFKKI